MVIYLFEAGECNVSVLGSYLSVSDDKKYELELAKKDLEVLEEHARMVYDQVAAKKEEIKELAKELK